MRREVVIGSVFVGLTAVSLLALKTTDVEQKDPNQDAEESEGPCDWLAGDMHARTANETEGTSRGSQQFLSTQEQVDLARGRGLSYIVLGDHENFGATQDQAFKVPDVLVIPGYEKEMNGDLLLGGIDLFLATTRALPPDVQLIFSEVRSRDGYVQLAHPEDGVWLETFGTVFVPDVIEVWRLGPFSYDVKGSHKDPVRALELYDRFLDLGGRVAVAGGSDNALRALSDLAGIGQPTAWVCAEDRTVEGIVEGIAAGRTTLSYETPVRGGPLLTIEGDSDADGSFETQMGGEVDSGDTVKVAVKESPASILRLIGDGSEILEEVVVDAIDFSFEMVVPAGTTWLRAELYLDESFSPLTEPVCRGPRDLGALGERAGYCRGLIPMLALSSPIYVSPP